MYLGAKTPLWLSITSMFGIVLPLIYLAAGIFLFVLIVKLCLLGIKALKIYIEKNQKSE